MSDYNFYKRKDSQVKVFRYDSKTFNADSMPEWLKQATLVRDSYSYPGVGKVKVDYEGRICVGERMNVVHYPVDGELIIMESGKVKILCIEAFIEKYEPVPEEYEVTIPEHIAVAVEYGAEDCQFEQEDNEIYNRIRNFEKSLKEKHGEKCHIAWDYGEDKEFRPQSDFTNLGCDVIECKVTVFHTVDML